MAITLKKLTDQEFVAPGRAGCAGCPAVMGARMTTKVLALPQVGQTCFMMGWPVGREGRKIKLAGTLHDQDGRVLVISQLLFITLKQGVTYESFAPSGA